MPDPRDEPPQTGAGGPGEEVETAAGAFAAEPPTKEQLDERERRISKRRRPMGPPPDPDARVGAFGDHAAPPPDVPPTDPS